MTNDSEMTGWTVVAPGVRTSYRRLQDAHMASLRQSSPILRDGRVVTVTVAREGRRVKITGWWAQ